MSTLSRVTALQRVSVPLFSLGVPVAGMPTASIDTLALYAGETLHRIEDVVRAADAVTELAP